MNGVDQKENRSNNQSVNVVQEIATQMLKNGQQRHMKINPSQIQDERDLANVLDEQQYEQAQQILKNLQKMGKYTDLFPNNGVTTQKIS